MTWIAWTSSAFVFTVLLHAVLARMPLKGNTVVKFVAAGGTVGLSLVLALSYEGGLGLTVLAGIALYAFLCELYIFAFTFVISSISVGILLGLARSREIAPEKEAGGHEMTQHRIQRLALNGFIKNDDRMLRLTPKGRLVVSSLRVCRRVFAHE